MNAGSFADGATAQALAFPWLRAALAPASSYGERVFAGMTPYAPGQEIAAAQSARRIAALANAIGAERLDALRDAFGAVPDAVGAIARASMGDVLGDAQFLELLRLTDAIERADALLDGFEGVATLTNEAVAATRRALAPGRTGAGGFYLGDEFSAELARARAQLMQLQAELDAVRGRALAAAAAALGRTDVSTDEFIVMRDDATGPLPPGVRVVREAPTYVLCALDYDDAALHALTRRDAAAQAVADAEEAVRMQLSGEIRSHAAALDRAAIAFGELDVTIAAARFARRYDCVAPEISAGAHVSFQGGRFLPLALQLETEGRSFTPLDVDVRDVAVLTGPNMGGKSACLRTCGFIATCASFGLPVPARSASSALFDEIAWLGIGSEEDLFGGLLSSFAKEVVRLRDVLERQARNALVLVDEFARTTTPQEGRALLVALVQSFRERGACGLVATHLGGVARDAGAAHFAVRGLRGIPQRPPADDLHQALATLAASMDYTIVRLDSEESGRSDAIALAALLGLDADFVARAYDAL